MFGLGMGVQDVERRERCLVVSVVDIAGWDYDDYRMRDNERLWRWNHQMQLED